VGGEASYPEGRKTSLGKLLKEGYLTDYAAENGCKKKSVRIKGKTFFTFVTKET